MRLVSRPKLSDVLAFCGEDPIERVFLEDLARRGVGRFTALADGRRLHALCHVGTNVVPSGDGTVAFAELAAATRPHMIVGDEEAVTDLWEAAKNALPPPFDDRPGQPVYVLDRPPPFRGGTRLRPAALTDLHSLVAACAAAYREEVGLDAHARDPELFEQRTRAQIEEGRSWLWTDGGRILFKAEASAWTHAAVQLQQVWVDPEVRGRGFGKRGMADLCALLLERAPAVCLFVRPENEPAIRIYEAVGMRRIRTYRSVIFHS